MRAEEVFWGCLHGIDSMSSRMGEVMIRKGMDAHFPSRRRMRISGPSRQIEVFSRRWSRDRGLFPARRAGERLAGRSGGLVEPLEYKEIYSEVKGRKGNKLMTFSKVLDTASMTPRILPSTAGRAGVPMPVVFTLVRD